ncbi:MAG: PilT protein domain protein [Deltaproteobacteria bacterium]|nr:PilT protein domain protein [Acidobacteriota bacterium]MBP1714309.1 PilT protein domain protein [Deltaproteobacteria bacterium]
MIPAYLFDSHALLAFFQKEDGAEIVARILNEAIQQDTARLICVMNLGEIIYLTKRRFGEEKKLEILGRIHQLGMRVLHVPNSLVYQAAELKAEYSIAYADCFALACAIDHSAVLVTGDPEFKIVAHLVTIHWIR